MCIHSLLLLHHPSIHLFTQPPIHPSTHPTSTEVCGSNPVGWLYLVGHLLLAPATTSRRLALVVECLLNARQLSLVVDCLLNAPQLALVADCLLNARQLTLVVDRLLNARQLAPVVDRLLNVRQLTFLQSNR